VGPDRRRHLRPQGGPDRHPWQQRPRRHRHLHQLGAVAPVRLRVLADYIIGFNPRTQDAIAVALLNGQDPHSLTVERVFGIPYKTVEELKDTDPDVGRKRKACKTTNFSAVFDIGPDTLAMHIHADTQDQRPLGSTQVAEAKQFLAGMGQANPDAQKLLRQFEDEAVSMGSIETLGGRKPFYSKV
jgi:DNA polymerase I-like protein with 3'-5' exonuclease and polymerase domains